jgi:hypothetical protein
VRSRQVLSASEVSRPRRRLAANVERSEREGSHDFERVVRVMVVVVITCSAE